MTATVIQMPVILPSIRWARTDQADREKLLQLAGALNGEVAKYARGLWGNIPIHYRGSIVAADFSTRKLARMVH